MKALSIQNPWAWLIVEGWKQVENRSRATNFRGQFLVHASKSEDASATQAILDGLHPATREKMGASLRKAYLTAWQKRLIKKGGIVGAAEIIDCTSIDDGLYKSPYFVGPYGYILKNALPLPFIPCRGQLGFFDVPDEVLAAVRAAA